MTLSPDLVSCVVDSICSLGRAEPLPVPKQPGQQCPGGYASGAHWCTPMPGTTRDVVAKGQGACPSKWSANPARHSAHPVVLGGTYGLNKSGIRIRGKSTRKFGTTARRPPAENSSWFSRNILLAGVVIGSTLASRTRWGNACSRA
jgi:hypothetical protein